MDAAEITLPVSREVARRLGAPGDRRRLGAVLSMALAGGGTAEDAAAAAARLATGTAEERQSRLHDAVAGLQAAAVDAGVTSGEVEAELAAWKVERAAARRR
jgi:hypothetical protein